jgi:hypothetical protein
MILHSIVHPMTWIVTLVFWSLLVQKLRTTSDSTAQFDLVNGHLMNWVMAVSDFILSNDSKYSTVWHVSWPILTAVLYIVTMVLVHSIHGLEWPYRFLQAPFSSEQLYVPVLCSIGMLAAVALVYYAVCILGRKLREAIIRRFVAADKGVEQQTDGTVDHCSKFLPSGQELVIMIITPTSPINYSH